MTTLHVPARLRLVLTVTIALRLLIYPDASLPTEPPNDDVLKEARSILEAYNIELGRPQDQQSPEAFVELKNRINPLWLALGQRADRGDKEAETLWHRLYNLLSDADRRITDLRKSRAAREYAHIAAQMTQRQEEHRRRGLAPAWNEPTGFRDILFGLSMRTVAEMQPSLHCGAVSCSGKVTIGTIDASLWLGFRNDRVDRFTLMFDSSKYALMKAIFLERYGSPTGTTSTPKQNRFGMKVDSEELEWSSSEVYVVLTKYGSSLDTSIAQLSTQEGRRVTTDDLRERILKGKKDL